MQRLEEIAYEATRHALSDQQTLVSEIRQRTGTLLAAHALVASFLGATAIRATGSVNGWEWLAFGALAAGLVVAAVLLGSWDLRFAVDGLHLYARLRAQAVSEAAVGTLDWLVAIAGSYEAVLVENATNVRRMSALSGLLGPLMIVQTFAWLVSLAR